MIYLGYYDKIENYNHIRIIAQGTKADRDDKLIRRYKVIEGINKTEALNQLSRISRED